MDKHCATQRDPVFDPLNWVFSVMLVWQNFNTEDAGQVSLCLCTGSPTFCLLAVTHKYILLHNRSHFEISYTTQDMSGRQWPNNDAKVDTHVTQVVPPPCDGQHPVVHLRNRCVWKSLHPVLYRWETVLWLWTKDNSYLQIGLKVNTRFICHKDRGLTTTRSYVKKYIGGT